MDALQEDSYRVEPGHFYDTPKELWGILQSMPPGSPNRTARRFLKANAELLGLEGSLKKLKQRALLHSLGATHVILQQSYKNIPVHRGYVTVHINQNNQIYLVKNRAIPKRLLGR
jgi:Zn-dependent metalloprotease